MGYDRAANVTCPLDAAAGMDILDILKSEHVDDDDDDEGAATSSTAEDRKDDWARHTPEVA